LLLVTHNVNDFEEPALEIVNPFKDYEIGENIERIFKWG